MPGSYSFFDSEVTAFVNEILPSGFILDVGPGAGKWGKLLKGSNRNIEAVEIHPPYIDSYKLNEIYTTVHTQDVCTFWCTYGQYNLVILGDVLEHIPVDKAQKLLNYFEDKNIATLVLVPYNYHQGESHGNPHERHHQPELTEQLFHERYPGFTKIFGNNLQGVFYRAAKSFSEFEEFCKQTLVLITTFNRPKITRLALVNIEQVRRQAALWIFDDASTLTYEFLKSAAPNAQRIEKMPNNVGIDRLRCHAQNLAFSSGYKYVYHTDNDAIHDPLWLNRLFEMSKTQHRILGLYNSDYHIKRGWTVKAADDNKVIIRSECPGISFFYDQSLLGQQKDKFSGFVKAFSDWDFKFRELISQTVAVSSISYVEHFGSGGLHASNFEMERAIQPTHWLQKQWASIITELQG